MNKRTSCQNINYNNLISILNNWKNIGNDKRTKLLIHSERNKIFKIVFNNNQMNVKNCNQINMNKNMNNPNFNQMNLNMMNFMMNYMTLYNLFNKNQNNIYNMEMMRKSKTQVGSKKSLPRDKGTISHMLFPQNNGPRYNIDFQTPAGFKVLMSVPINAKIGEILLEYLSVVALGPNVLGEGIYFLFNGNKIKQSDYNITASNFGINALTHIIVIDTKNLIGA